MFILLLMAFLSAPAFLYAQASANSGEIDGTVTDPGSAAVSMDGLRKGVIEYRMLWRREDILKLAGKYGKHIAVTLKKG